MAEIIPYIAALFLAAAAGGALGALSAYHSGQAAQMFYNGCGVLMFLIVILHPFARTVLPFGLGDGTGLGLLTEMFLALPKSMQWGVVALPVFFFGARMAASYYRKHIYTPPPETEAQRRGRRLINDFG